MILRFVSGSVTPASARRNRSRASTTFSCTPVAATKSFSTCSASPDRSRPWSTKTQVSWSADGLLHERRGDRGVDAAGQPADHPRVADLRADLGDLLLDDVPGVPVGGQPGALVEEVLERLLAERRVLDLGVPLHAVQAARPVLERGDRAAGRRREHLEALGRRVHGVAVAHPHRLRRRAARQDRARGRDLDGRAAVLTLTRLRDGPAERRGHRLEAVADAEHRHPGLEQRRVDERGARRVHRRRAAGQDDRGRVLGQQVRDGRRVRHDLGVDVGLADASGDQLRVLRAEVHDEHGTVGGGGRVRGLRHAARVVGARRWPCTPDRDPAASGPRLSPRPVRR